MTKTEEFISTLHLIAVASGNTAAVDEVFQRFLVELRQQFGPDRERVRRSVEDLQKALATETVLPPAGQFTALRDHARGLVAGWLRDA